MIDCKIILRYVSRRTSCELSFEEVLDKASGTSSIKWIVGRVVGIMFVYWM